jgi:hypothetical protein
LKPLGRPPNLLPDEKGSTGTEEGDVVGNLSPSDWADSHRWLGLNVMKNAHIVACVIVLLAMVADLGSAPAAPPASAIHKEAELIRSVLQANFQACNEENLDALMATCSREPDGTDEFAAEARKLFEQTDVYLRVADFELLELKPPYASARVIQITLPKDEKDRTSGDARQVFFRGNSALLPQWETCEYTQTFKKEQGKWKLYAITTKPKPAVWPPDNPNAIRTDDMPALKAFR